jgi:hypothetical protein
MRNAHRRRESANQKARSQKISGPTPTDESTERLFAFTINPKTAEVVKVESLDSSGARHELSKEEKAKLASAGAEDEIEDVVEQAFEAGIACVLGTEESEHKEESAEDAELRHLLVSPLIQESPVRRLIRREALSRASLGTLIRNYLGTSASPQASRGGAAAGPPDSSQ